MTVTMDFQKDENYAVLRCGRSLPISVSSTHGGNPVCAAAALANLQVLDEEGLIDAAARTGELVLARLRSALAPFADLLLSVHGHGSFVSIHFVNPDTDKPDVPLAETVVREAVNRGVMMFFTHRGCVKFTPPLNIDLEAALEAADVLSECVAVAIERSCAPSLVYDASIPSPHILQHAKVRPSGRPSLPQVSRDAK